MRLNFFNLVPGCRTVAGGTELVLKNQDSFIYLQRTGMM